MPMLEICALIVAFNRIQGKSETFPEDADDVFGLAHGVEMHCRDTMCDQVLALGYAPVCSGPVNGFPVVACGPDFGSQFHWW